MSFEHSLTNKSQVRADNVSLPLRLTILMFLISALCFMPAQGFAAGTPNGQWIMQQGSGAPTSSGDYVGSSAGLNTYYVFYIEVPPNTSNLTVDIFDADVGAGGVGEAAQGRDRVRNTSNSSARYRLYNPGGTRVVNQTCTNSGAAPCLDNAWSNFYTVNNPAAGHWQLTVDMSSAVTAGDDINAYGIRATDSGGKELNIYAPTFYQVGVHDAYPSSRTNTYYPFITSGCLFDAINFDWDYNNGGITDVGSISYASRTGNFSYTVNPPSPDSNWQNTAISGWTSDVCSADYGTWSQNVTIKTYAAGTGNYGVFYTQNFNAANPPPTAQPQANTFRVYLPTSASGGATGPQKPIVTQTLSHVSGPNPPAANQTTRVRVQLSVINPTPYSITFSAANLVTANVPGAGAVYAGNAIATQGTIATQPAVGGTGNLTWNPGTVAGGTEANLTYDVNLAPTSVGQRIPVTGTSASNGTTARYVDETGNTTQALATYTYGPLCELAATAGGNALPTRAVISSFDIDQDKGRLVIQWETTSEVGTAGFYLFRLDQATGEYKQINHRLLPALINSAQGGIYRLVDPGASLNETNTYVLVEVESRGTHRTYGPFTVGRGLRGGRSGNRPGKADGIAQGKPGILSGEKFWDYSREPRRLSTAQEKRRGARKVNHEMAQSLSKGQIGSQVKITIAEKGLYYLKSSDLSMALGISEERIKNMMANNQFSLSSKGQMVSYMTDKENSGIYFYGREIDSIYTRNNVYWLKKEQGARMKVVEGTGPSPAAGTGTFTETLHFEEDHIDAPGLFTNPSADYWFWDYIVSGDPAMGSRTFTLQTKGVSLVSADARLTVDLRGATSTSVNKEHHAIVSLNGTKIGETSWEGTGGHIVTLHFSQNLLKEGENVLDLTGVLAPGVPYSIFLINSFDLTYKRVYHAVDDTLLFRADGNEVITVGGFTSPDIGVFEITDSNNPQFIEATTRDGSAGNYRVSFEPVSPDAIYLAVSGNSIKRFTELAGVSPTNLKENGKGADYLVITVPELNDAARTLADYRRKQGLTTMVVNLEDVMNEFNSGIYDPEAIRNFLLFAYQNWKKPPRYAVFAGNGTYDYKDHLGCGDNLIPVMMVPTRDGLFPSDNYFADINGDYLPEIAVGRLPAVTPDELMAILSKIQLYEDEAGGPSEKRVLMLADNPDDGGNFPAESEEIASLISSQYTPIFISLAEHPLDEARSLLLNEISHGPAFLNYIGHGGVDRMSKDGLLTNADVASMTHQTGFPIVTAMTCVVGQFSIPGFDSLAEELVLRSEGGAVAIWAPSGLSVDEKAFVLDKAFFQETLKRGKLVLGEVILKALKAYQERDGEPFMMDIYNLLGDPALKIRGN